MTLATDYLLGMLCAAFAMLLLKNNRSLRQSSIRLWAIALMAVAVASFAGGTYHGFRPALSAPVGAWLWKVTMLSMGVASFMLLASAFSAAFSGHDRRWLIAAAAVKLGIYAAWMLGHDEFRFVIYEYGSTLAVLLLLLAADRMQGTRGLRACLVSGVLVSIVAAVVQQSGIRLHRHFNHNDLMHVVQMGGMWLLYEGGARLRDAGGTDGAQS